MDGIICIQNIMSLFSLDTVPHFCSINLFGRNKICPWERRKAGMSDDSDNDIVSSLSQSPIY